MAYKFQLGSAILSGSTKFEEEVDAAGGLKLSGVDDTALDVSADSFLFRDADGTMKRDTMADYATAIAGDGLAASSGVLAVGVDDSTVELDSDALRIKDSGVGTAKIADNAVTLAKMAGITRGSLIVGDSSGDPSYLAKGTAAQFLQSDGTDPSYVTISGDATIAAGGALTIANDAVESGMLNDNVISGQTELASDGLAAADELMISDGGTLKKIGVDNLFKDGPGLLGAASVDVSADHFMFLDGGATGDAKTESVADLMTAIAGSGLKADAGVLEVRVSGSIVRNSDKLGISGSIAGDGLKFLGGANAISTLEVDLNELPAAAVAVANDSIAIIDSDDNGTKKESIADLMTAVAGNGLAAASGVLSLDASEVASAAIASGDHFVFHDVTDDSTKKETVDDLASFMAGVGLAAASGVLTLDIDELGALGGASVDQGDNFLLSDGGTEKKVTFSNLEDSIFGNVSGDVLIAAGGAATIQANAVEDSMVNDNVATGLAGVGLSAASGVLALDASELSDAAVASGDKFVFQDATDDSTKKESIDDIATFMAGNGLAASSGVLAVDASELSDAAVASGDKFVFQDATDDSTKKESIDDIATFMAGSGLSAASGVLSARHDVAAKADGDTLAVGVNYFADLSSDATVALPASPSVGDTVVAKAKGLSSATIIINRAGSQTIDGETSVTIESPFGAVTMVYVANDDWRLI
tara:strand:- start:4611 stop:6722 length:2112 start_codon:yes stop_codon:yes gene_type:complete